MRAAILGFGLALAIQHTLLASDQNALIGSWRLVSNKVTIDNEQPRDYPGPNPKGHLILTPGGRMIVLITSGDRKFGSSDAEQARLQRSMLAYTGRYRIEGTEFITTVDASWNEAWNGTEQRRHYALEGDRLTVVSEPTPVPGAPGKIAIGRLVWERER